MTFGSAGDFGFGFNLTGGLPAATGEQGGAWTPVQLAKLDYQAGEYTVGETSYSLADAVETDPDWGEVFNPVEIVNGTGWRSLKYDSGGTLKGPFLAVALEDHVCVIDYSLGVQGDLAVARYDAPDFTTCWEKIGGRSDCRLADDVNDLYESAVTFPLMGQGPHKEAILMASGRLALSIDGDAAFINDAPIDNSAANRYIIQMDGHPTLETITIRSMTFYAGASATAADLPALSEIS